MEVLLSRQTRRVSRVFIVVLLVSFSAAALSFIYKMNHQSAGAASVIPSAPPLKTDSALAANIPATQPAPEVALPSSRAMIDPPAHAAPQPAVAQPAQPAGFQSTATTEPSMLASSVISSAQSDIDNGRLLSARSQLNDSLQSGELSVTQTASVKSIISQ